MVKKGQPYTSGNWLVTVESEESFIDRWTAFTECPLKNRRLRCGARGLSLVSCLASAGRCARSLSPTTLRWRLARAGRRTDRELPRSASPLRNSLMPFLILMQTSSVSFSGVLRLVRITNRAGTDFSTASPSLGSSMNRP
jgi:hypothetical protein